MYLKEDIYKDLSIFRNSLELANEIRCVTDGFLDENVAKEIRKHSRSVCSSLAAALHERSYKELFIEGLCDAGKSSCETQIWIDKAKKEKIFSVETADSLSRTYDNINCQIINLIYKADEGLIRRTVDDLENN